MQVFITSNHDKTMINSDIVELLQDSDPTDEELNELDTLDTDDMHYDVYDYNYADAVMMDHLENITY